MSFCESFPFYGGKVFAEIFEQHQDVIKTQKARFALNNLNKLFDAAFEISLQSGFDKMSLRELSNEAQMSMGAIYSCIDRKEDIGVMIYNVVKRSNDYIFALVPQNLDEFESIKMGLLYHLYASTILRRWYFFLYFETRSLPIAERKASINIETQAIHFFEQLINQGAEKGQFKATNSYAIANMLVVMLEDWYLKPWKSGASFTNFTTHSYPETALNNYYQALLVLIQTLLQPQYSLT